MFNVMQFATGPVPTWVGLVLVWTLIWKGIALWKAARKTDKVWYVVMIVLNTAGILEILYIYIFSKRHKADVSTTEATVQDSSPKM